jgi:hypothetical protein
MKEYDFGEWHYKFDYIFIKGESIIGIFIWLDRTQWYWGAKFPIVNNKINWKRNYSFTTETNQIPKELRDYVDRFIKLLAFE